MPANQRDDPFLSYRFAVEFEGIIVAGFSEVAGLQVEMETEDYREGGLNEYVHKLPNGVKYQNITLKKGITNNPMLWNWHQNVINGKIDRRLGFLILIKENNLENLRWAVEDAYPVKWIGPDFKAEGNNIAVETLELTHNGIKKV